MRILGIDPGLRRTGFGVLEVVGHHLQWIGSGTIVIPSELPLAQRLKMILDNIREVVDTYQPEQAAVEKVFVNMNPASTLLLGQARGVALCALADKGLAVTEYTALQIKKSVVGKGHADKEQVQSMVKHLLGLSAFPAPDAADALACAICHAHTYPLASRLSGHSLRIRAGRLSVRD